MTITVLSYIHALLSKLGPSALSPINRRLDKSYRLFSDLLTGIGPDIILLQEVNVVGFTITDQNFPFHLFPQYNVYFANNFRAAVLVNSTTLNSSQLNISNGGLTHKFTFSSCWVEIKQPRSDPIIVCSLYRPGNCSLSDFDPFWAEYHAAIAKSHTIYVCGDINAEHGLWGALRENTDGTYFADKFLSVGLTPVILPSPSFSPFGDGRASYIDVTCTTPQSISRLSNWRFDFRYDVESDHHPISFDILGHKSAVAAPYLVWDLRDVNWELFARDLSAGLDHWMNSLDDSILPDAAAESWTATVLSVAQRRIGKVLVTPGKARLWWHPGIRKLIAVKHRTRKRAQRTKNPIHIAESRKARRDVDKAVSSAKKKYWARLVARLNDGNDKDFCRLYRRICCDRTRGIPPLVQDGKVCVDSQAKSKMLLDVFKSAAMGPGDPIHNKTIDDLAEEIQPSLNDVYPSSARHLQKVIKGLSPCKAFGIDDIHPEFLKEGGPLVATSLNRLFTLCWQCGCFPCIWKRGKICPISKTPRPSSNPRNYRPIALLSVVGKLFESVLVAPLRHTLLSNGAISRFQSGFLPARNCEEQVIRLTEDILYQFECRAATTAVFLDISKAYDSVWRNGLRYDLIQGGVSGNLATLCSFLAADPHVLNLIMCSRLGVILPGVFLREPGYLLCCLFCTSTVSPEGSLSSTLLSSRCTQTMLLYGPSLVPETVTKKHVLNYNKLSTLSNAGATNGASSSTPTSVKRSTSLIVLLLGQCSPFAVGAWSL